MTHFNDLCESRVVTKIQKKRRHFDGQNNIFFFHNVMRSIFHLFHISQKQENGNKR